MAREANDFRMVPDTYTHFPGSKGVCLKFSTSLILPHFDWLPVSFGPATVVAATDLFTNHLLAYAYVFDRS